jgi:MFS family permease
MAEAAQTTTTAAVQPRTADPRRWFALAVVLGGTLLVMMAISLVTLAIPAMRLSLHASFGQIQLVIAGYTLVYAIFLIAAGHLGDLLGRKHMLIAGVVLFTLSAAACGLAPNTPTLIAARMLQGLGGALMYPQFLTIIQDAFEGHERDLALGAFGAMIGIGVVIGQVVGGAVISLDIAGQSWRPAFLLLVPIGAVLLIAAWLMLDNRRNAEAHRLDGIGVVALGIALSLFIVPLVAGRDAGWPVWMLAALVASIPAFGLFVWYEHRRSKGGLAPLLDPALFRRRAFVVGCLMGMAFMTSVAGFLFTLSITLQVGAGFSPLAVGLAEAPLGVAFFVASLLVPRLVNGLGRHVLTLGYAVLALGILTTLAVTRASGEHLSLLALVPGLVIMGIGQGLGLAPLIGTVLSGVRREDMGAVAGALPTSFQVGQVLGIAVIGLVFFVALAAQPAGATATVRYLGAFAVALPVLAGIVGLCLLLVFALPRTAATSGNALLERVPNRMAGLFYSLYFASGGHVGGRALEGMVHQTISHRTAQAEGAPTAPADFLVYHFDRAGEDAAWYRYLVEEALTLGAGRIPYEEERLPVIALQVEEVRRRQAEGAIGPEFDPAALRLLAFALSSYPRLLPQVTRMTTGHDPDSAEFKEQWRALLRQVGALLAPPVAREEGGS